MQSNRVNDIFSEFIYKRTYSRYVPEKDRRETWEETVDRYFEFFLPRVPKKLQKTYLRAKPFMLSHKTMGSMRSLWAAGPALDTDNLAGYNCAALNVDNILAFPEMLYILMNGAGCGFSVERQVVSELPDVPHELKYGEEIIKFEDSKIGWAEGFEKLIRNLYDGKLTMCDYSLIRPEGSKLKTFGGRACLTGDTIVYKDRKKSTTENEITIKQLFDIQTREEGGMYRGRFKKIKLRSLDEKLLCFYRNNIIKVIDNGVAPVFKVETNDGYTIKSTGNHRFMDCNNNWIHLDDFKIGDKIAVNGEVLSENCVDCNTPISRRSKRCFECNRKHSLNPTALENTARQRKECRAASLYYCEKCGVTDTSFNVHHIDKDVFNNDSSNLINLCPKCHQNIHAIERTYGNPYSHKYLSYDTIISITECGEEQVFDLEMESPDHNFVANGFVSHNSGPDPLERLVKFTVQTFEGAKGRKLNSLECHDLMCYIASIVVAGGVRRSSTISLSNLSDQRMQTAKTGSFCNTHPHRALANNSVAYTEKPDMSQFMKEWERLMLSQSGERGIFNREAAIKQMISSGRRKPDKSVLCNPCQPPWATILTSKGISTIGKVKKGDEIWSKEGWTTITKKWSTGVKDVLKYRTTSGVVYCTENHRLVSNGLKIEAKDAKSIDRLLGKETEKSHHTRFSSDDSVYIENKQIELSARGIGSVYTFVNDQHMLETVQSIDDITSIIIETSQVSNEEVFDITVDNESHTYWSGGCNISNCSEILLKPSQMCNLSEVIIRSNDTLADLTEKIKYATILGVLQSTLTDFKYVRPEWKINCDEERLLGVSLTGIMDHPVLSDESNPERMNDWLTAMKDTAIKVAKKWCKALDINMSAAITTVKPSGTVSLLCNTSSGIHPRFSNYYIRRVRVSRVDPISTYLIDKGVPYDVEGDNMVFAFPIEAPKNAVFRDDKTALQQLEHWKIFQDHYCEHKPSITVYVREHEWLEVGAWVYKHFDIISGVSFLPYDNGIYKLAPYEAITEDEYIKLESAFPTFDFEGLSKYEHEDNTEGAKTLACSGSSCEI